MKCKTHEKQTNLDGLFALIKIMTKTRELLPHPEQFYKCAATISKAKVYCRVQICKKCNFQLKLILMLLHKMLKRHKLVFRQARQKINLKRRHILNVIFKIAKGN